MKERLQKLMSAAGICSRRQAEEWIKAGRIYVNGTPAKLGDTADIALDVFEVDGKRVSLQREPLVYIMLNKPTGYVTTLSDEKGRRDVSELVKGVGTRVYPIGRLDLNSSGLLLMSNDGELANTLMHPKYEVEKEYLVGVTGMLEPAMKIFRQPMALDGRALAPFYVEHVRTAHGTKGDFEILRFRIHEGRNRQVRRMCQCAGLTVLWLQRVAEGALHLDGLKAGQWRYLRDTEIQYLKSIHTGEQ